MRNARQSLLVALTLAGAATCAVATTMTVHLKDGTVAKFDTSKIASVTYSETVSTTQPQTNKPVLEESFRSGLSGTWEPIAVVGGDYNRFAKITPGLLEVNVPAGNHWTKTGIMSAKPLFTVTAGMETAPVRIELTFDAARTTGCVIGLTEAKDADMWRQQNVWFHFGVTSPTETFSYLVNTQNGAESYGTAKGPASAPTTVILTITPGFVRVETSTGMKGEGKFSWLRVGAPVYFYIFTHPKGDQGPAAFALQSIRMYTGR
jgi:hypothetical protein